MSDDITPMPVVAEQKIIPVDIEAEMKKYFIDYAMSVIVDRALPDVRDGLKPVHRRILYAMFTIGYTPDKAHRKSATTVGEVMGKFHPHGDAAIYDSLVRMAQDFSLRYPLIDPHGNFGSRDGDMPAAMRYTEARLSKIAMEMLQDIKRETVDFKPNYDDHETEPTVLPSRFPNLLVNGSSGIAVGMATNIPPHNLGEVIDGIVKVIDNPETTTDELVKIIKGPDFPTCGIIMGKQGIIDSYNTGRGRIVVRSRALIEQHGNRQRIIVTELPYQVNKARLIEKIAEHVKEKRIEGISGVNDESGREDPVRIVVDLKREANANVVLNQLYKNTQMQDVFSVNMLAIVPGENGKYEPAILNLRQFIDHYIAHQEQIITRRTKFDLEVAEGRAHLLEGFIIALDNIDEVISIIRASKTEDAARQALSDRFGLSTKQTEAIVDMRLGRLTGLERDKIKADYAKVLEDIKYYREILANESIVLRIIKEELLVNRSKYADARRTEIQAAEDEIEDEDLISEEEVVITLTHFGYIKRLPVDTYRSQRRGGRGKAGVSTREEDFVENLFITSTHDFIMFFTNKGRVFRLKAYEIHEAGRHAKGIAIVNLLQLGAEEKVTAVIPVRKYNEGMFLVMLTKYGIVKKTDIMAYDNIRKVGLTAVVLRENDELIDVKMTDGRQSMVIVTREGMSIRFNEDDVRAVGRVSQGVKAIRLDEGDYIVGMDICSGRQYLLVVTENGFGKRTEISEYKIQSRAGKGILTYRITSKTGKAAGMKLVDNDEDIMLISSDGTVIRLDVSEISILGRSTQGVTLMRMQQDISVVSIATTVKEEDRSGEEDGGAGEDSGDEGGENGGDEEGITGAEVRDEGVGERSAEGGEDGGVSGVKGESDI